VTVIAIVAACDVGRVLAGCGGAVMAGVTGPQHLGVIDSHHGGPEIRGVAILADIRRLNVRSILTGRVRAVMTARTVAGDAQVVEVRRQPGDGAVTVIAIVAAGNVSLVFAACGGAVMTGAASSQYLGVIDGYHGGPEIRGVAILADIRRLNVRRSFAGRLRAVMAAYAIAGDVQVVEICR